MCEVLHDKCWRNLNYISLKHGETRQSLNENKKNRREVGNISGGRCLWRSALRSLNANRKNVQNMNLWRKIIHEETTSEPGWFCLDKYNSKICYTLYYYFDVRVHARDKWKINEKLTHNAFIDVSFAREPSARIAGNRLFDETTTGNCSKNTTLGNYPSVTWKILQKSNTSSSIGSQAALYR